MEKGNRAKMTPVATERQNEIGSVVWNVRVQGPPLLGAPRGRVDWLSVIIVALMALNYWIGNWPISIVLAFGFVVRLLILRRYVGKTGLVEHELSESGARRGEQEWDWDEFESFWILHTKDKAALELNLHRKDARREAVRLTMPATALTPALAVLDQHLPRQAPVAPPPREERRQRG